MHYPWHKIAFAHCTAALLWLPVCLVSVLRSGRQKKPAVPPKKIVIQNGYRLGDLIILSRVFKALRMAFPAASIDLLSAPAGCRMLAQSGWFNRCIPLEPPWLKPMRPVETLLFYWRTARRLRKESYDLAIDFQGDPRGCFLLWGAGIGCIVSNSDFGAWLFCSRSWPIPKPMQHQMLRGYFLFEKLTGIAIDRSLGPLWPLPIADCVLPPATASPTILFHVGASRPSKQWSASKITEMVTLALAKGWRVQLLGGADEAHLLHSLRYTLPEAEIVIDPPFTRLAVLTKKASVTVCFDSFMLHAAYAIEAETIALFGPTDPRLYAPLGGRVRVLCGNTVLYPPYCQWRGPAPIESISSSLVVSQISQIVETQHPPCFKG